MNKKITQSHLISDEKGNVLFIILIAVALFAALSYAVTSSSNVSSNNASKEQAELAYSQISQHVANLRTAVKRLKIVNGCEDNQISFSTDSDGDGEFIDDDDQDNNNNAPDNLKCHVFHKNGGGLPYLTAPPKEWIDPSLEETTPKGTENTGYGRIFYISGMPIAGIGSDCDAGECNELLISFTSLTKELCQYINKKNDIPYDPIRVMARTNLSGPSYSWNYTYEGAYTFVNTGVRLDSHFQYKYEGCFENHYERGLYFYYAVLLAR